MYMDICLQQTIYYYYKTQKGWLLPPWKILHMSICPRTPPAVRVAMHARHPAIGMCFNNSYSQNFSPHVGS